MTKSQEISHVIKTLRDVYKTHPMQDAFGHDAFQLLIAVVLSQRSRDDQTIPVAQKLFQHASTPQKLLLLSEQEVKKIIRSIGFYNQKTEHLFKISKVVVDRFNGVIPNMREQLLSLPGVGRKTANIVLSQYFHKPAIAVDIHVHRITNRLGWIQTQKPEETEMQLMRCVPQKLWSMLNWVFVRHGQEVCKPRSPECSVCSVEKFCKKVGVEW